METGKANGTGQKKLETCGDVLTALTERYGTKDIGTITRLSGVSRSTLTYWMEHPNGPIYKRGRNHIVRIFGVDALPHGGDEDKNSPMSAYDKIQEIVAAAMRDQVGALHADLIMQRQEIVALRAAIEHLSGKL